MTLKQNNQHHSPIQIPPNHHAPHIMISWSHLRPIVETHSSRWFQGVSWLVTSKHVLFVCAKLLDSRPRREVNNALGSIHIKTLFSMSCAKGSTNNKYNQYVLMGTETTKDLSTWPYSQQVIFSSSQDALRQSVPQRCMIMCMEFRGPYIPKCPCFKVKNLKSTQTWYLAQVTLNMNLYEFICHYK